MLLPTWRSSKGGLPARTLVRGAAAVPQLVEEEAALAVHGLQESSGRAWEHGWCAGRGQERAGGWHARSHACRRPEQRASVTPFQASTASGWYRVGVQG